MEEKVIILPLDSFKDSASLMAYLEKTVSNPDLLDALAMIKLNDAVHTDIGGPSLIGDIRNLLIERQIFDVGIFLDLKVYDVSGTLANVLSKYAQYHPDIVTVSSQCSVQGIIALRKLLPNAKLALVSALTDMSELECQTRFGVSPQMKILNDLENIQNIYKKETASKEDEVNILPKDPFDLVVCSAKELPFLRKNIPENIGFIVPGIRDAWMNADHQKRTVGVGEALGLGATFVVMGAQITKGAPENNISAEESLKRTMKEIRKFREKQVSVQILNGPLNPLVCFDDPLQTLKNCDGCYVSPKDASGKPLGPLVGYAGTYADSQGEDKNYVGFEYFNFAKAEQHPSVLGYFAFVIAEKLGLSFDVAIGAPMGGLALATELARLTYSLNFFFEKRTIALAEPARGLKEQSDLVLSRHEIDPGSKVVIVEDVCNNLSTAKKARAIIESQGGILSAIVCAVNRSGKEEWEGVPIISAIYIPTAQYRQDDPEVASMIAEGKIIWKPKKDWTKLREAMQ
jgi:orotate phosphoribosyltransferase